MTAGLRRRSFVISAAATLLVAIGLYNGQINAGPATGSLTIKIKPKEAKQDGARWRVDGGAWQKGGKTVNNLAPGNHEVSFKNATGWKTPKDKTVAITSNHTKTISGKYKPDTSHLTITLPGNVPMEFVWIPAGSFQMGRYLNEQDSFANEIPQHNVTFAEGFWMGKYEVTKGQWQALMNTTPWPDMSPVITDSDSAAVYITWDMTQLFVAALNEHIDDTDQGAATFHLPSEAQWEYACRAGTTTRFYWGDDASYTSINNYAWWFGNAYNAGEEYAHIVGLKLPNAWGLYDMSGNGWEFCEDRYSVDYIGAPTDGSAWFPAGSNDRVKRGGGWGNGGDYCRSAVRGHQLAADNNYDFGFRLVR
ncbi:MAG: formylglycine-generating enzyme family protein [Candidatus Hydrogenedentes bacterium]|nr:formylglycine-generating enzyme family protein [Candidatus Hydrogenedentota bacterium]